MQALETIQKPSRRSFLQAMAALGTAIAVPGFVGVSHGADGATVRFALSKPAGDIDPHKYRGVWGIQDLAFEPLIGYGERGAIEPVLASAWEVLDNGAAIRFTLRGGVTFQDGTPWDAAAFKWNLERWITLEDHNWMNIVRLFDSIVVHGEHDVEVRFKEPPLGLLFEFTYSRPVRFLSPASVAADGSYQNPVGTGPWIQVEANDSHSLFRRFDGYWGDAPAFEQLEMVVLPDSRTRMSALRAGEIDVTGGDFLAPITATEARSMIDAGLKVSIEPGSTTIILGFNPGRNPALGDPAVRHAINIGFDRAAIAQVLYRGFATPAGSLFSQAVPLSGKQVVPLTRDIEQAKALLEEAGWTGEGIRSKDGQPLSIELVVSEEQIVGSKSMAETIQAQLAEAGIGIVIRSVDHASRHSDIPARNFDMAFFLSFGAPYEPFGTVIGLLLSTYDNGVDGKLYLDPEGLDPLVLAAMAASEADSQAALQAVYDWLETNYATAPLLYAPSIWAVSDRVATFEPPATEYDTPFEGLTLK